ncbi:Glucose-6-phosphate 1-dehydrogenase [Serendipita sp. 398]|nr:Glucose-6-phosphate 1-dehydrogenase [Serendipita sp. 398]
MSTSEGPKSLKENTVIIVLGASGDLAKKKTFPALFGLYRQNFLPNDVHILGYARTKMDEAEFHKRQTQYIKNESDDQDLNAKIEQFKSLSTYVAGDYDGDNGYQELNRKIEEIESKYKSQERNRLFYMALPPSVFQKVAIGLKKNCYTDKGTIRVIVEKPFGKDLQSSRELLGGLKQNFTEEETFRIDHYLGKEMVKVLKAIPPVSKEDVLLGQYVSANGKPGYLDDDTVPPNSNCPTFAAVVLWIHNERWEGVPFILKAGKALNEAKVEVRVQYKDVTQGVFRDIARNELVMRIQPSEAIYLKFNAKTPGLYSRAMPTEMDLTYKRRFADTKIPEAYEALILDALHGDKSNFVRDDELDVAWKIFTPILHWIEGKSGQPPRPKPYPYGSRGPKELDEFIGKFGYKRGKSDYSWPVTNVSNL